MLDEPAWRDALVLELAYELIPGDSTPAPVRTEVLLTHDQRHLYFAFRAHDPDPARIRAHLADRDKIPADDYVGLVLDTFADQRRAFEFEVNPLGVQRDYFRNEVTSGFAIEDITWDAIWQSAGRITAGGYEVEAAVPFSSLRFPRLRGEQRWGFTAYRAYPRNVLHVLSLVPTDRNDPCLLCQTDHLHGLAGVTPGRNLEVTPTVTGRRVEVRDGFPGGRLETADDDADAGISVRWGVTPNLSLNATLNPDFSQVEADAAQLDVNTRFALFFPEKRPFFLEGADTFNTPLSAVYTRTVADPSWGLKLSGKEGPHVVGGYVAEDDVTNLLFPANQGSAITTLPGSSRAGVLRYRRDLGASSALGLLWTGREAGEYRNHVYGVDGVVGLSPSDTLQLQALGSRTEYPAELAASFGQPQGSFGGSAFHLRYDHNAQDWTFHTGWERLGRNFRADSGFIPRVDTETLSAGLQRIERRPAGSWFTLFQCGFEASRTELTSGDLSDQAAALVATWQGPLQSTATLRLAQEKELFAGVLYDQNVQGFTLSIQPSGDLTFNLSGDFGDTVDLENQRAADLFRLGPGLNYRLGRHLELDLRYLVERLDVPGGRLYEARLSQAGIVYQLNVRTFVRAILQHFDIRRQVERYLQPVEPSTETLFTQLLLSYKLNPQTVVFLGYSDNHLGLTGIDLTRTDRTLFAKVGYAWGS